MLYLISNLVAQVAEPTNSDVIAELLKFVGGIKGASALAISIAAIQLVMLALRAPLANFAGKWKLLIVASLSIVAGVLAGVSSGASLLESILNGTVLAAVQVLVSQIQIQFFTKEPVA